MFSYLGGIYCRHLSLTWTQIMTVNGPWVAQHARPSHKSSVRPKLGLSKVGWQP
jgi:hypothetical protein